MCVREGVGGRENEHLHRSSFLPSLDQYHLIVELLLVGFWSRLWISVPFQVPVEHITWATNQSQLPNLCVSTKPCQRPRSELRLALQLEVSSTPPACWLQAAAQVPNFSTDVQIMQISGKFTCSSGQAALAVPSSISLQAITAVPRAGGLQGLHRRELSREGVGSILTGSSAAGGRSWIKCDV